MTRPDLTQYQPHLAIDDIELDGVAVPGLRGEFLRRLDGDQLVTLARYSYAGRELFMAWGYAGEEHSRYHAVRGTDGDWERPQSGCPRVRVLRNPADEVAGLALRSATGDWLVAPAQRSPSFAAPPVAPRQSTRQAAAGRVRGRQRVQDRSS